MFSPPIYDDNVPIAFETVHPVLFSIKYETAFEKKWKPWKHRYFAFRVDSTLVYRKTKQLPIKARLRLEGTRINKMTVDAVSVNPLLKKEFGISATCTIDGIPTSFRCVLGEDDLELFFSAIRANVKDYFIDEDLKNLEHQPVQSGVLVAALAAPFTKGTGAQSPAWLNQSAMRVAITHAMDKHATSSNRTNITRRRGAMKYLPVYFSNDLVHGSWYVLMRPLTTPAVFVSAPFAPYCTYYTVPCINVRCDIFRYLIFLLAGGS